MRALTNPNRTAPPISARARDAFEVVNTPFRFVQDGLRFPRSEARMTRRILGQLAVGTPIVVYSAPKTASTAVAAALDRTAGLDTVKVHFLQPQHFWAGPLQSKVAKNGLLRHRAIEQRPARRLLLNSDRPLRIVSVVRDPIAFNLSNYTYFGRAYWMRTFWRSAPWIDTQQILRHFLETFPHESSSLWWQHEFARSTGINPVTEGFDTTRGAQRYQRGRFDCLVLRADLEDRLKHAALCEWTGREVSSIERENPNDGQAAPGVYARLKQAIRNEHSYLDRMLDLPAVHAFYSKAQRDALRAAWSD